MPDPQTVLQDRYLVTRRLGQGGMGAVFEAVDRRFGNTVAVKQALFATDELGRAFEREARLLRGLKHAALPGVIDYFHDGGSWYVVMDYVPGEDLAELAARARAPFGAGLVLRWADQILDVLEYLHGHEPPVIHRDIKPQNLKLTPDGRVMLLDFGLSKGFAAEVTRAEAGRSLAAYTLQYAPPEQIRGTGTDARSDLYALGATLWTLAAGRLPPDAMERMTAIASGLEDPLPPADRVNPEVPPPAAAVLHRALALDPDRRPATAQLMRQALRAAGDAALAGPTVKLDTDPGPAAARTAPAPAADPRTGPRAPGATGAAVTGGRAGAPRGGLAPLVLATVGGLALLAVVAAVGVTLLVWGGAPVGAPSVRNAAPKPPPAPAKTYGASVRGGVVSAREGMTVRGKHADVFDTAQWGLTGEGHIWRVYVGDPLEFVWRSDGPPPAKAELAVEELSLLGDGGKLSSLVVRVNGGPRMVFDPTQRFKRTTVDITGQLVAGENVVAVSSLEGTELLHGVRSVEVTYRPAP